ncbi:sensor histidine kinase [Plantactinospora mayteni]|uniref:histidine kinase n=1 Tax=Plantactinospora mayteni TaxID=566021 RepID=A0ABQ4EQS5_9ACTN|nr:sensor histidine kinase [Plantactinospora mayteni]GIG97021.1 two-component sensor histidine kinase [Plantactinospora mayteni]
MTTTVPRSPDPVGAAVGPDQTVPGRDEARIGGATARRRRVWNNLSLVNLTLLGVPVGTAVAGAPITYEGTLPLAAWLGLFLLLRRRWPVAVLLVSLAAVTAFRVAELTEAGWVWPASVIFFVLAADDTPRRHGLRWAVGAGLFQLTFAVNWQWTVEGQDAQRAIGEVGGEALGLALTIAVAVALRNWLRWRTELAAGLAHAEQERRLEADRRGAEERLQIARELHDVVAHTLTVVGVQLRVVDEALDDSTAEARAALRTAQEVRGKAVADLRSLIDVLRAPGDRPDADSVPAPQADLGGLAELAARTRASGLAVALDVTGDPDTVAAPVALACYRVIQEALTNTVNHAGARRATVRLVITPDSVRVEVVDDGSGPGPATVPGHGINGMRERVAALGGTLTAGAADDGGYAVCATIPVAGFRP